MRWKRDFGGGEGHYWAGPSRRGVARTARSVAGRQIEIAKIDSFFSGDLPTTIGPFRPTGHNHLFIRPIHPMTSLISSPPQHGCECHRRFCPAGQVRDEPHGGLPSRQNPVPSSPKVQRAFRRLLGLGVQGSAAGGLEEY